MDKKINVADAKQRTQPNKPRALAGRPTEAQTAEFENHPLIRKFRNDYSNWRKGASKGATGELTTDRVETTEFAAKVTARAWPC